MKIFKKIFCKHDYEKVDFKEMYDHERHIRYSMRLYKCRNCGKEIWVDGRNDPYEI